MASADVIKNDVTITLAAQCNFQLNVMLPVINKPS